MRNELDRQVTETPGGTAPATETEKSGPRRDVLESTHIVIEEVSIDGICGVY
jgi:mycofactocin precursor